MVKDFITDSVSLSKYKETMMRTVRMYSPNLRDADLEPIIDYSINKRYKQYPVKIDNNYTNRETDMTLLELTDYINSREPIVTAHGVMFRKHGEVPNPLSKVIQKFLDKRGEDKKMMFKFPKGSEEFEKYNLLQQLDKIDCNGIYGALGMYTCLIYNLNVAASITSQGRALVSSAGLQFEMFLANNVKFGSLNEVITFIDNIVGEKHKRKYRDCDLLDSNISVEDCFAKVVMTCGYRWIPTESDLDVIWRILYNLQQEDINRIYYKNNLYEFLSNQSMIKAIIYMLDSLDKPFMNPLDPPKCIRPEMDEFTSIMMEYVYYSHQIIDRIDRMDNMIKSVCLISDTDSTIISLDAFYRFVLKLVEGMDFKILHQDINPIRELEKDEFDDVIDKRYNNPITFKEVELDFDFYKDEIVELEHTINPLVILPQDNLRYSIINILAYTLDKVINDYMIEFTKNNHSYRGDKECKIIMKNEFFDVK